MAQTTQYVIRTCGREPSYLLFLGGEVYGWTWERKRALRFDGPAAADEAVARLEAAIRANGYGARCEAIPATGGMARERRRV